MTKVAILRCEKNENRCPLTSCFQTLINRTEGFASYTETMPAGVFTCRCPGDNVADLAGILKSKGAQAIHFCTCTFAKKTGDGWDMSEGGFCEHLDEIMENVHEKTGLRCVKGSAHLPEDYTPVVLD